MSIRSIFDQSSISELPSSDIARRGESISSASVAFGFAAIVTIIFNTLLAWAKDAYEPLNAAMARLTGHHWITHGVVDLLVFCLFGTGFLRAGIGLKTSPNQLALELAGAVILGGLGLAAWFVLV